MSKRTFQEAANDAQTALNALNEAVTDYNQMIADRDSAIENNEPGEAPTDDEIRKTFGAVLNAKSAFEAALDDLSGEAESLAEELQEKYDSRSERWQESEAGSDMQDKIMSLEEIAGSAREDVDNWECPEEPGEEIDEPQGYYTSQAVELFE